MLCNYKNSCFRFVAIKININVVTNNNNISLTLKTHLRFADEKDLKQII